MRIPVKLVFDLCPRSLRMKLDLMWVIDWSSGFVNVRLKIVSDAHVISKFLKFKMYMFLPQF